MQIFNFFKKKKIVRNFSKHSSFQKKVNFQAIIWRFRLYEVKWAPANVPILSATCAHLSLLNFVFPLTCSRWKRNSLCTWRASCHRDGPCSDAVDSACIRSWTHRTRTWGYSQDDCRPPLSHQVSSWKTFDCGRPAGNDWAADEHPLAPGMTDLRERRRRLDNLRV